jgi:hypothetical protein
LTPDSWPFLLLCWLKSRSEIVSPYWPIALTGSPAVVIGHRERVLKHLSRKRFVGAVASFVAAYALALNVVLSSMLLAAVSPAAAAAGFEICANNPDLAAAHDDAGKSTGKAVVHCPICVGNHAAGVLPPTGPSFAVRIAVTSPPAFTPGGSVATRAATSSHQARAPPRLS